MTRRVETCSRVFGAAAGAFLAGSALLLTLPGAARTNTVAAGAYDALFEEGAICTSAREDTASLVAELPTAPVMRSLEYLKAMIASYKGSDLPPTLTQDPDHPNIYTLRYRDENGKPHRDGDPAVIVFDAVRQRTIMTIWAQHGVFHRDRGMPASTEWDEQGRVTVLTWRENGVLQNPTGGPSLMQFDWDNDRITKGWYRNDVPFRPDSLPSVTKTVISNGLVVREEWANRIDNERLQHRSDGLHIQEHDPITGLQIYKRYFFHDHATRSDEFIYQMWNNPRTGLPKREEWKMNDVLQGFATYDDNGRLSAQYPNAVRIQLLREKVKMMKGSAAFHDHSGHTPSSP
ncbi:MAG: hypothetical protein LRY39_00335 [Alphaproteobacteria bacterium]|nr:hypothetical protein [Alphaproteobacteria bacterium]